MLQRNRRIEPCLPSAAKGPPIGPDWLHEIKHDGFRILVRRDAKGARLYTTISANASPWSWQRSWPCRCAPA
jgi:ATP-dependent DNA ligase